MMSTTLHFANIVMSLSMNAAVIRSAVSNMQRDFLGFSYCERGNFSADARSYLSTTVAIDPIRGQLLPGSHSCRLRVI